MARLKSIADEAGGAGKIERGLGDVVTRIGFDAGRKFFALGAVECGPMSMP